jgi:hypothetical protein
LSGDPTNAAAKRRKPRTTDNAMDNINGWQHSNMPTKHFAFHLEYLRTAARVWAGHNLNAA